MQIEFHCLSCPYCGENVDLEIDASAGSQTYYEDCGVCCCPMVVTSEVDAGGAVQAVNLRREDE